MAGFGDVFQDDNELLSSVANHRNLCVTSQAQVWTNIVDKIGSWVKTSFLLVTQDFRNLVSKFKYLLLT